MLLLAFVLSLNGLNITSSYVGRDFMSAVAERQANRYYHFFLLYLVVFAASTVVTVSPNLANRRRQSAHDRRRSTAVRKTLSTSRRE